MEASMASKASTDHMTPEQLHEFLRSLLTQELSGDPSKRIHDANNRWDTVILGLSDSFLASFPFPSSVPWSAMKEKVALLETALEIIYQASIHVNGLFTGKQDMVLNLFARLLNICSVLDVWLEGDSNVEDGFLSPSALRQKSFQALVGFLRCLGGDLSRRRGLEEPRWKYLRTILDECTELVFDITIKSSPVSFPVIVSFFKKPRLHKRQDGSDEIFGLTRPNQQLEVTIISQTQLTTLLALLLDTLVQTLYPPILLNRFLCDVIRKLHRVFDVVVKHFLSTECPGSLTFRTELLRNLVSSAITLSKHPAFSKELLSFVPFGLLKLRIQQDGSPGCNELDAIVLNALEIHSKTPPIDANAREAARMLSPNLSEDLSALTIAYLRSSLQHADDSLLLIIRETLSDASMTRYGAFLAEVGQCTPRLRSSQPSNQESTSTQKTSTGAKWRRWVRIAAQSLVEDEDYSWMDVDDDVSDRQYAYFNLYQLREYLDRPAGGSKTPRVDIVNKLSNLINVISSCDNSPCSGTQEFIDVSAILDLVELLLQGPQDHVTTDIRRQIFTVLSHAITHHDSETEVADWNRASTVIMKGVVDSDRSVRLTAGHALRTLLQICCACRGEALNVTSQIFEHMYHLLETSPRMPISETLIITIGSCGETQDSELLGQVICLLVAQLGQQNPLIRGTASVKFFSIASKKHKTPYSLVQPYLNQIAPFLITRMCSQPILFQEACRAMGTQPHQFIVSNLARSAPQVFADCDKQVLESLAKELSTTPSTLFLKHSHKILAHVFLRLGQPTKALNFILKILVEDSQGGTISVANVIKSCLVPLLTELIIYLGDDNQMNVQLANVALVNVERSLAPSSTKGRPLPLPEVGAFLRVYMLGIFSELSDMLQGVQGKISVGTKRQIIRSIGALVTLIGQPISNVAPQIMAIFQTMICVPELSDATINSWHLFLSVLGPTELSAHVGATSASFVACWPTLSPQARESAAQSLSSIVLGLGDELKEHLNEIVDLAEIDELKYIHDHIQQQRAAWTPKQKLQRILDQSMSENLTVSLRSVTELKNFLLSDQRDMINELASGDTFDPMIGKIVEVLFSAACRDGDGTKALRLLAYECLGILGALDPDRFEMDVYDPTVIVSSNYTDEAESISFALHLIKDLLVGAFRSTSDMGYQTRLAYVIQELLKFCQFTPALIAIGNSGGSVPLRIRNRWNSLPKHVLETVSPLLEARYALYQPNVPAIQLPVYSHQVTYRDWIQTWTLHLITKASGSTAKKIFDVFRSVVRYNDVVIAHHILPHLVLNVMVSGDDESSQDIRSELLVVLEDQVNPHSDSPPDKKLLSAQAVFMLLDHLSKWVRNIRQDVSSKKSESKRSRANQVFNRAEEQLLRIDSVLSSIDQHLMAKAAFQCKAYARALMNFEQHILTIQERTPSSNDIPTYYEKLHEIYAHLDEPDGMEGVSTLVFSPSLEHRIRQHESTGSWTSAQSCWELRLQESPDNVEYHLGLLRCLRNLGHYDSLRTHVRGVLTRYPEWEGVLIGYQVESAWMVGAWDEVQTLVEKVSDDSAPIVMARVLLSMRAGDGVRISESLRKARLILGAPTSAAGVTGYRRAYDAVLNLHLMHELEMIYRVASSFPTDSQPGSQRQRRRMLTNLSRSLSARFDTTLPTFRAREPLLSMRRTAFTLSPIPRQLLAQQVGHSWIASAKIARKAGQWQTAYSAMLQAQHSGSQLSFVESAKLVKARGEHQRALRELENSMHLLGFIDGGTDVLDLTIDDEESILIKAKARVLRARWMHESQGYESFHNFKIFVEAAETITTWETGHFRLGQFHDECFKALNAHDKINRGLRMNLSTVRSFAKAIKAGSKYVYQAVPRILTIWLDLGEDRKTAGTDTFRKINENVAKFIKECPAYKWYTAFPQIVSRVGIVNPEVYKHLSKLIIRVIEEYPRQALWLFTSVIKSTKANRESRGKEILDQLRNNPSNARTQLSKLINQSVTMTNELLALCDHRVSDDKQLSMTKDFPKLAALGRCQLLIPLQESLTASLPPTSALESVHQPFSQDAPTFEAFADEIEVMRSMARPRKITIKGSNGETYMFLGKPKDDLRKDARLMDFNAIINKLLKASSESRRRQLHIRTYGVVTLNEECGFIQWVPNTIPIRPVLLKYYDARGIRTWTSDMNETFRKIKDATDKEAAELFSKKVLPTFPPVFHEWFIETFPEPTAWLTSRLTYSRTAAVMSMVGFILGLGDRHGENILLDTNTGDVVHVDFNCLFEKGKTLETPERVPFRLTQNIVDGLGVTGVEGVFRIACEVTLQLLRDNKDSLMNVLDAFAHDPLVEWEDEKRKLERDRRNQVKASVDLRMLAKNALDPIEKKLKGVYTTSKERQEKEIPTSSLVHVIIQEATDTANLAKMYPGWAPWL